MNNETRGDVSLIIPSSASVSTTAARTPALLTVRLGGRARASGLIIDNFCTVIKSSVEPDLNSTTGIELNPEMRISYRDDGNVKARYCAALSKKK